VEDHGDQPAPFVDRHRRRVVDEAPELLALENERRLARLLGDSPLLRAQLVAPADVLGAVDVAELEQLADALEALLANCATGRAGRVVSRELGRS
jgi:hypothetical protein